MVSVCGIGVVGNALVKAFTKRKIQQFNYDKYKKIGHIENLLKAKIIFLCLPTLYSEEKQEYDKTSLYEVCDYLGSNSYKGLVVVKSTVEPGTCRSISGLRVLFNPEFLSARTAVSDFENQKHIVIGGDEYKELEDFYRKYWPNATISKSTYEEAEIMKIGINSFYAVKIQFFNEIYSLSSTFDAEYNKITEMMLKNSWIAPHHLRVPGVDGKLSYGGMCFPKDTNALYRVMQRRNLPRDVLGATIHERNIMRDD
jgi:UDPglucose 6-dehydrogenase